MSDDAIQSKSPQGPDLRGVEVALLRAAQRARERARATGTRLVLSRNGVLEFVPPDQLAEAAAAKRVMKETRAPTILAAESASAWSAPLPVLAPEQ